MFLKKVKVTTSKFFTLWKRLFFLNLKSRAAINIEPGSQPYTKNNREGAIVNQIVRGGDRQQNFNNNKIAKNLVLQ